MKSNSKLSTIGPKIFKIITYCLAKIIYFVICSQSSENFKRTLLPIKFNGLNSIFKMIQEFKSHNISTYNLIFG